MVNKFLCKIRKTFWSHSTGLYVKLKMNLMRLYSVLSNFCVMLWKYRFLFLSLGIAILEQQFGGETILLSQHWRYHDWIGSIFIWSKPNYFWLKPRTCHKSFFSQCPNAVEIQCTTFNILLQVKIDKQLNYSKHIKASLKAPTEKCLS